MAQQSLNNNVTFGEQRTKINDNFTELYTNKVDKETGKSLVLDTEIQKLSQISGTNTGNETTSSIQTKRPLKTVNGNSLEGTGNVEITSDIFRGAINLSTPAPTLAGIYQPTVSGTYTNFGGLVVNLANGFTTISFDGTNYSQQVNPLPAGVVAWTATTFATNTLVSHLGKYWRSNAAIVAGDVPGTSTKWVEELIGYNIADDILNYFHVLNERVPVVMTSGKYLNASGGVQDVAGNWVSPRIRVNNAKTLVITGSFNTVSNVSFFSEDGLFHSNIVSTAFSTTRTVTIPNNVAYYQFGSLVATNFVTTTEVNFDVQIRKEVTVSLLGNDATADGSAALPYRTINRALASVPKDGIVNVLNGDYFDEIINTALLRDRIIRGQSKELTRLIYGTRITTAVAEPGYTKVFKRAAQAVSTLVSQLWQHDITDASTVITLDERKPIHKDRTHRLTSTRLIKVASIAAVEASAVPCYFHDGTDLYFQPVTGSNLVNNPIVIPDVVTLTSQNVFFNFENFSYLYRPLGFGSGANSGFGKLTNLKVGFNQGSNVTALINSRLELYDCELFGSANQDGASYFGTTVAKEVNCWCHSNFDEGSSTHELVDMERYRGLYEKNDTGISDVGSSRTYFENVLAVDNTGTGFIMSYYAHLGVDRGSSVFINCISDKPVGATGAGGKRVKAYGCVGFTASAVIQVL